eukprot:6183673-Pleurochrysis_carterae.AAC.6
MSAALAALAAAAAVAIAVYIGRKWLFGPIYKPGCVSANASVLGGSFDSELLVKSTTSTTWNMPNGISIHHFAGPGPDNACPVLCIHGGPAAPPLQQWKVAEELAVLCPDAMKLHFMHQRGCGHSSRPFAKWPSAGMWPGLTTVEQTLGIGEQIADIERARRRLGVDQLVLVGHSFGGFMATLYAAEFPHAVKALVLIAPAAVLTLPPVAGPKHSFFDIIGSKLRSEEHQKDFGDFLRRYFDFGSLPKATETSLAALQEETLLHFQRAAEQAAKDAHDKGLQPEISLSDEPPVSAGLGGFAAWATYISMGREHDYRKQLRDRLQHSAFPVAIVHGTKDIMPPSSSQDYGDLFPSGHVSFHEVDGGHFVIEGESAKDVAKIIISTVAACDGDGPK